MPQSKSEHRQFYQPRNRQVPAWLWRLWVWC